MNCFYESNTHIDEPPLSVRKFGVRCPGGRKFREVDQFILVGRGFELPWRYFGIDEGQWSEF